MKYCGKGFEIQKHIHVGTVVKIKTAIGHALTIMAGAIIHLHAKYSHPPLQVHSSNAALYTYMSHITL